MATRQPIELQEAAQLCPGTAPMHCQGALAEAKFAPDLGVGLARERPAAHFPLPAGERVEGFAGARLAEPDPTGVLGRLGKLAKVFPLSASGPARIEYQPM